MLMARRLQDGIQQASAKLQQQQAAATKAVADECERHVGEERALQQQVQQLKSDLAVAQVSSLHRAKPAPRTWLLLLMWC